MSNQLAKFKTENIRSEDIKSDISDNVKYVRVDVNATLKDLILTSRKQFVIGISYYLTLESHFNNSSSKSKMGKLYRWTLLSKDNEAL